MNLAIDLTQIPCDKTGVGQYAFNVVQELCSLTPGETQSQFFFFVQDDDTELLELLANHPHFTIVPVDAATYRSFPARMVFEQFILPRKCRELQIDTLLSTHYTIPYFTGLKRVVTFHDMTFYLFPEHHQRIKRIYFKLLIPLSVRYSNAIITVSQSTKNDMLKRFPSLNPDKLSVIHLGVNPPQEGIKELLERVLQKYRLTERNYFLFVGTLEPRKNIVGIIKAFHRFRSSEVGKDKPFKLVIAGKKGWFYEEIFTTVKALQLDDEVLFTGYIEEEEKTALLLGAYLFVFPSFYEGFGIPVLEAMSVGTPVITGNVSSLPEVTGNAAIQIEPGQWLDISEAMMRLVTDHQLYDRLAQAGPVQASHFTWRQTARKTVSLLETIAQPVSTKTNK